MDERGFFFASGAAVANSANASEDSRHTTPETLSCLKNTSETSYMKHICDLTLTQTSVGAGGDCLTGHVTSLTLAIVKKIDKTLENILHIFASPPATDPSVSYIRLAERLTLLVKLQV